MKPTFWNKTNRRNERFLSDVLKLFKPTLTLNWWAISFLHVDFMHLGKHQTAEHLDLMMIKSNFYIEKRTIWDFSLNERRKKSCCRVFNRNKMQAFITCRLINRTIDFQGRKRSIPHHVFKFILPLDAEENGS